MLPPPVMPSHYSKSRVPRLEARSGQLRGGIELALGLGHRGLWSLVLPRHIHESTREIFCDLRRG